jgi:hypothetical protein
MNDLSDFPDVLAPGIRVEETVALEFELDGFILRRESRHWEIQFESAEGEEGIVVEREDFVNGKLEFDIDGQAKVLPLEDFDRIEKFAYENGLIDQK